MIGVVGAGTMGKGIAIEFARFNNKVMLISAERYLSKDALRSEVEKVTERFKYINKEDILANISTTNEFSGISDCELIIEAVSEDIELKRKTVSNISRHMKEGAIIASNTSSLSIEDIFYNIISLENVIGLHFFNPVQIMKLVELSYLKQTRIKTIDKAKRIVQALEKEVVLVKNSPGFIVNRLLIPMINEAATILDEGIATVEDIDRAMKFGANHPMGPLKLSDLIGNDIVLAILGTLNKNLKQQDIAESINELVEMGRLGRKSKGGFYDYSKKK